MPTVEIDPDFLEKVEKETGIHISSSAETEIYTPGIIHHSKYKGAGKTLKAFCYAINSNSSLFCESFDGQSKIIRDELIHYFEKSDPELSKRIKDSITVVDFFAAPYPNITSTGNDYELELDNAKARDALHLMEHVKADYLMVDSIQDMNITVDHMMRYQTGLTLKQDILGQDMKAYGVRNTWYRRLQRAMMRNCQVAVLVTSKSREEEFKDAFGKNAKNRISSVKEAVESQNRHIVELEVANQGMPNAKWYARYASLKDIHLGKEGDVKDVTGLLTPIFAPEIMEYYRKGRKLEEVKSETNIEDHSGQSKDSDGGEKPSGSKKIPDF